MKELVILALCFTAAQCFKRQDFCTRTCSQYKTEPYCVDGTTYDNYCYVECEKLTRVPNQCDGRCPCRGPIVITKPTEPVRIDVPDKEPVRIYVPDNCGCSNEYDPVCATNDYDSYETYDNECKANCENKFKVNDGPCY